LRDDPWRHACPRGHHLGSGGRCGGKTGSLELILFFL
jgi:hypothetical protein